MEQNDKIQLFEDKRIRTAWDEEKEEWFFSIVDVIAVLTDSENPRRYWSDLKRKLKAEGADELYEKIVQLKLRAPDGKRRLTDVANTQQLLRIIQSIPSPKAEPFRASRIFSQIPLSRHRQNRRCTFFQFPYASGKSRQGAPVRRIQNAPLINCRVSRAFPPRVPFSPMGYGLIFSHALSLISCRCCFPAIFLPSSTFEDHYITLSLTTPSKMNAIQKSKAIKNGLRKGFQDGSSKMAKRKCYGYTINSDGELEINPDEAKVVSWMFEQHLAGNSLEKIVASLERQGIPFPAGRPKWNQEAINKLLSNEKYTGRVLLQKAISTGTIQVANNGLMDRYLYTKTHGAIISDKAFIAVQHEKVKRSKNPKNTIAMCQTFW